MAAKVSQHVTRAPKGAPVVTLTGGRRVTSNAGTPKVSIGGTSRPTTTSRGKGK